VSTSITLVIPTRNRAELAMAAATGLLAQGGDELRVVVSDSSPDEDHASRLADFCDRLSEPRLTYLRAPEMPMPTHWNWALEQALAGNDTTHFSIHYDRKLPKPGQWRYMLDAMAKHPDRVITYTIDQVVGVPPRLAVWQTPWTGETYEIATARVLQMVSEGLILELGQAFPILSNCAVPRAALEEIRRRFGDVCDSTGPDATFSFRLCAFEDSYLHLDRALGVTYANHRSAGQGYLTGSETDYGDFKKAFGDRPWLDAVALPELDLGGNMLMHEYELVRREVGDRFPPLTTEGYLNGLAYGLDYVADPVRRKAYTKTLVSHGWRPPVAAERATPAMPGRTTLRRAARRRAGTLVRRSRLLLQLAVAAGAIPEPNGFTFTTEEGALRFAKGRQRRRTSHNPVLDPLLES
jgi:hypothetical protein